jgi:hypothetical protein
MILTVDVSDKLSQEQKTESPFVEAARLINPLIVDFFFLGENKSTCKLL